MKYAELKRRLTQLGCRKVKEGARHEIWERVSTGATTLLSRHDSQESPPGTLANILKQLGISRDEFGHV
ncbi:MAG: type II toxin-antitoxin system HicA family toxin [Chloroflexi bacterium]|nr:type II toxin-antitoxin system HicA family toxin [Chloroflexota bacterium]